MQLLGWGVGEGRLQRLVVKVRGFRRANDSELMTGSKFKLKVQAGQEEPIFLITVDLIYFLVEFL